MAQYRPEFQVGNVVLPIPESYEVTIADLSTKDSGRTLDGVMHKKCVGEDAKISCAITIGNVKADKAQAVLAYINCKDSFPATIMDPRYPGQMMTYTMYSGDRTGSIMHMDTDGNVYWDLSFSLIQV